MSCLTHKAYANGTTGDRENFEMHFLEDDVFLLRCKFNAVYCLRLIKGPVDKNVDMIIYQEKLEPKR